MVFLDHQSSTAVLPEVFEAMRPFYTEAFGSPSSFHQQGLRAREALQLAREQVAALIGAASPEEILFTASGTESANLALKGVAFAGRRRGRHLVLSRIEHPAVLNSAEFLEKQGFSVARLPVDSEGFVDPAAVAEATTESTILICLQLANHDVGALEPVAEVGRLARDRGIPLFVDASYGGGWLPIDVGQLGASLLSLAPHRFYGPKGVGVLYRHRSARLASLIHGGAQEFGWRAGTENVPAIVGAGVAAERAAKSLRARIAHTQALQRRLWEGLREKVPYLKLNGPLPGPRRVTTSLNVSPEFVEGEGVMLMCDVQGLAIASGTSCVSKALEVSHVLAAMGVDHALAQASVLLSAGSENTQAEIDRAIDIFAGVVRRLREMSPLWEDFQRGLIQPLTGAEDEVRDEAKDEVQDKDRRRSFLC